MDTNDSTELFLYKIWPVIEANKKRIVIGVVVVAVVVFGSLGYSWESAQKEIAAGEAYTKLYVSAGATEPPSGMSSQYLQIAADHPGTEAAQRALVHAGADLFASGKYADAEAQFQKFVDAYPESSLAAYAQLGLASSLEAEGKTDAALDAYKKVAEGYNDFASQVTAKLSIGRIYEQKNRIPEAIRSYDEVARTANGTSAAQDAMLTEIELKSELPPTLAPTPMAPPAITPAPAPAPAPAASKLTAPPGKK